MEHETVEKVTKVLRDAGFRQVETRRSSTMVTVSAVKDDTTAILHFTDTAASPPVRTARVGVVPEHAVKAFAPGAGAARSGSGA
jgi:GTP cyclohydrolase III